MHGDRGDIILHGLMRTVAGLLVVGVIVFEVAAVTVNRVQLDDAARTAVSAAAQSWGQSKSTPAASQAALDSLSTQRGIALETFDVGDDILTVTLTRDASVLVLDQIGPLAPYAHASATKTAALGL